MTNDLAKAQVRYEAAQARTAITRLTIEDARRAKFAIETLVATWKHDHPYQGHQIQNLTALVGAPGLSTWQAHFASDFGGFLLPDIVFEIEPDEGTATIAAFVPFMAYQFNQGAVIQEAGAQ